MFELTYTPVDKAGTLKSETTVKIDGYNSITEVLDDLKSGMSIFQPVEAGAHVKECVASKLSLSKNGLTYWNTLEALRRSPEWHQVCNAYTEDATLVEKWTLDADGRNERGATSKKVALSVELTDDIRRDDEREIETVESKRDGDVWVVKYKVPVRDYTPEERASVETKAVLKERNVSMQAYIEYVGTCDGKAMLYDDWCDAQNDND